MNHPAMTATARSRIRRIAVSIALVVAAVAPVVAATDSARAAPFGVVEATANTFIPPEVTIDEGGSLQFLNADVEPHDVTSQEFGSDGAPLFASATISAGTAPVEGVGDLDPGTYSFYCTVHDWMSGLLTVEAASGTVEVPKPPPSALPSAGVSTPTSITTVDDTLYVSSFVTGTVSALPILDGGLLGPATDYATGFSSPLGIVFGPDGTLFVSDSHPSSQPGRSTDGRVWAIPSGGGAAAEVGEVVIDELPNGRHNTNGMAVRDGRLYITNGNSTDDGVSGGDPEEPLSGTLLSVPTDARGLTPSTAGDTLVVEAVGMRNIYDVAFRGGTREAWIPMNGPDQLDPYGEDLLLKAVVSDPQATETVETTGRGKGRGGSTTTEETSDWAPDDFGFPGCVYADSPDGPVSAQNPAVIDSDLCDGTHKPPEQLLGLHTSADGLAFGPDDAGFWDGDLFIALWGSIDATDPAGHTVIRVPIDEAGNAGEPVDFYPSPAPLDVTFGPPGTGLYVADFSTGQITLLTAPPDS